MTAFIREKQQIVYALVDYERMKAEIRHSSNPRVINSSNLQFDINFGNSGVVEDGRKYIKRGAFNHCLANYVMFLKGKHVFYNESESDLRTWYNEMKDSKYTPKVYAYHIGEVASVDEMHRIKARAVRDLQDSGFKIVISV